jgi:hypothetical protein
LFDHFEKETKVSDVDRWDLVCRRDDLSVSEVRSATAPELQPGEVSLAVEKFGMTTNNATYARFGDDVVIAFWNAFPGPAGYGRVPVWGVATVEDSLHPDIEVGTRYFGFLPMGTHHVVAPQLTAQGFFDATPVRDFLHPWYRSYQFLEGNEGLDDRRTLLRPVYPASFNLADFVVRKAPRSVIVTGASSKVAIGLAEELVAREVDVETIGITAERHLGFVDDLGFYSRVISYDELASLTVAGPTVFVDVTGSPKWRTDVCAQFADQLSATALVGFAHSDASVLPPPLAGPEPEVFFTPAIEMATIAAEGSGYVDRYNKSEERFAREAGSWLSIRHGQGPSEILAAFRALLSGAQSPSTGVILHP